MKFAIVLCCVLLGVLANEKYTDKYDNTNIDEILANDKLLQAYFECVMGRGKCTAEGKELKEHLEEALKNECEKCTDAQKEGIKKVIKFLIKNKEKLWEELANRFDHDGTFRKKYEDQARAEGIDISK